MRINIKTLSNQGGGFAQETSVPQGTTVGEFIRDTYGDPEQFNVRVNRGIVHSSYVLQEGDEVRALPTNMKGAA